MKKNMSIFIVLIMLLLGTVSFYLFKTNVHPYINQGASETPIGELTKADQIEESFYFDKDNLSSFDLLLSTYKRKNSSLIKVELLDANKESYFSKVLNTSTVVDNAYMKFDVPVIRSSKGKQFFIRITSVDGIPGNAITLWKSNEETYEGGELFVNNKKQQGDLVFKVNYESNRLEGVFSSLTKLPISAGLAIFVFLGMLLSGLSLIAYLLYKKLIK
ncbi:hypothetical protein [Saccharibacillus deserti]|uniref:hypothetical protein n=1 Tax=Saccharibacillus deserti TaxID=1634444 RepID=UPI0015525002|nr:hypothetical protein [Saccharibacillus deserti]